ncbi:50S ribosomal protein L6 [Candidatus Gracilibacteria bacterium]|nr:50S ribosomal protein L6 [Candidatus Gracilibacteria bacterium]MCF7856628.1 50S ribosomal protein L6 [Candidatus Gracilibacteria bacterium]MCF7896928.1 50S ribosomal protein L6 [Candidatus Gracilibacteria bacterium]
MSRIGKNPVSIPAGVTAEISGDSVKVKGPKGELTQKFHQLVKIEKKEKELVVSPVDDSKTASAMWGLSRSLLANMVEGVTTGFSKKLVITGVGYKVALKGKDLELQLGFSHPVPVKAPEGIEFEIDPKKNTIVISGIDKQLVGEVAANIRKFRKPEPYKGKGIAYEGEYIPRKAGKSAAK